MNRHFKDDFVHIFKLKMTITPYNIIIIIKWYNSWSNLILTHYGSVPLFIADMNNNENNYATYVKIYKICNEVNTKLDKSIWTCIFG